MVSTHRTLNIKRKFKRSSKDGNVVIGFCTRSLLMLDLDLHPIELVKNFVKKYSKTHKLGSVLLLKTSNSYVVDASGNKLDKYSAIFGKVLSWKEIRWHLKECRRLEMVEPAFLKLRKFGYITIRVNAKNKETPAPKIVGLYNLGDVTGILRFEEFRQVCKNLGKQNADTEL
jgi:hypothetical protein